MQKKNELLDTPIEIATNKSNNSSSGIYVRFWASLLLAYYFGILIIYLLDANMFILIIGLFANLLGLHWLHATLSDLRGTDFSDFHINVLLFFKLIIDAFNVDAYGHGISTVFLFLDLSPLVVSLVEWTNLPRLVVKWSLLTSFYMLVVVLVVEFFYFFSLKNFEERD
jgi:hypothetical protein